MKKIFLIAVVALFITGFAVGLEEKPAESEVTVETVATPELCPAAMQAQAALSTPEELGLLPWETRTSWLPSCSSVHGSYCPVVGGITRCLLAPFEPEICVCQSDNTWRCYW